MKKIKGTIKKNRVEGGVWVVDTGKEVFQLKDGPKELYQEGKVVSLKGNIRKDLMGIGMAGPIFEVKNLL